MADKDVKLKNKNGDVLHPATTLNNVEVTAGHGIIISGNTIACSIPVAGTTSTATPGAAKFSSTYFTVDANGFVSSKLATTSAKGVASFSSTYFTVSGGVVSAKTSSTAQYGMIKLASNAEALTGTDSAKAVTPAALKYVLNNSGNGGSVSFASDAEALAGTSNSKAISPYTLSLVLNQQGGSDGSGASTLNSLSDVSVPLPSLCGCAGAGNFPEGTVLMWDADTRCWRANSILAKILAHVSGVTDTIGDCWESNASCSGSCCGS